MKDRIPCKEEVDLLRLYEDSCKECGHIQRKNGIEVSDERVSSLTNRLMELLKYDLVWLGDTWHDISADSATNDVSVKEANEIALRTLSREGWERLKPH